MPADSRCETSEVVLAELSRLGLLRPTEEDALRFAIKYPCHWPKPFDDIGFIHVDNLWKNRNMRNQSFIGLEQSRFIWSNKNQNENLTLVPFESYGSGLYAGRRVVGGKPKPEIVTRDYLWV